MCETITYCVKQSNQLNRFWS